MFFLLHRHIFKKPTNSQTYFYETSSGMNFFLGFCKVRLITFRINKSHVDCKMFMNAMFTLFNINFGNFVRKINA